MIEDSSRNPRKMADVYRRVKEMEKKKELKEDAVHKALMKYLPAGK